MFKYTYPMTKSKELDEANELIYLHLMNLGFKNTRDGTYHFKNIVLTAFCERDRELSYAESLVLYSKMINKSPVSLRSDVYQTFCYINQSRYLRKFIDIFNYESDSSLITPSNLFESFEAFLQLKNFKQS